MSRCMKSGLFGYPFFGVMNMKYHRSVSLRDFGVGLLLGGSAAAVLIAAVYLFVLRGMF